MYYKFVNGEFMLLTVKARYGKRFPRGRDKDEDRI